MKIVLLMAAFFSGHIALSCNCDVGESAEDSQRKAGIIAIDQGWFISRISLLEDRFSRLSHVTGKETFNFAIEPQYFLQSYSHGKYTKTSPIKKIRRDKDYFTVYTESGSVYGVHLDNMIEISSIESLGKIFEDNNFKIYRRRDLREIKKELDSMETLPGQNYKTWISFTYTDSDCELFNFGEKLRSMKNKSKAFFNLREKDINTLKLFL